MSTGTSDHHDFTDCLPRSWAGPAGSSSAMAEAVRAYAVLNSMVHADRSLGQMLNRVAELAQEVIDEAEDVSITVVENRKPRSVAFTGSLAVMLDERQYEDGYGPCVDAAQTGRMIEIPDTGRDMRYPIFSRLAYREGVRRTLSVGMPTRHQFSAGMNIYGRAAGSFSPETRDIAAVFAGYAAIPILNATLYNARREEVEQIRTAMASRAEIEQAKGMIMRDHRCTADEAFDLLRRESGRAHRKLRDVARSIVENAKDGR